MKTTSAIRLIAILSICAFGTSLSAQEFRKRSQGSDEIGGFKAKTLEVIYVDNQSAPGGTGSKANPVDTIQDGVDVAFFQGAQIVVVRGGGSAYVEDVTVLNPKGLKIYGDGDDISCDKENPYAGEGNQPVLEGGLYVEGLPFFTLMGLTIFDGFAGDNGVEIVDVEKVQVTGNRIHGTGEAALFAAAVLLRPTGSLEGDFVVSCNQIDDNGQTGIALIAEDEAKVTASFTDNELSRNMGTALRTSLHDASVGKISATDNSISGNGVFGFGITGVTFNTAKGSYEIARNQLKFVGHAAFALSAVGDSKANFAVTKNIAMFGGGVGVAVQAQGTSDANFVFSNNTVSENSDGGIHVRSSEFGATVIKLDGNLVAENGDFGFNFFESGFGEIEVEGNVNNNTLPGNSGNEVQFTGTPGGSFVLNGSAVFLPVTIP